MRGHVRKRGNTWCVVLDAERDAATGKRRQKWFSGYTTKRAAEDALVGLLGKRQLGHTIDPDLTPLAEHLTAWLDGRSDELAPLTVTQYRSIIRNHIADSTLGATPLGKVRRAHLRAHEAELRDKGLADATRSVVRAVISRALADAVEDDLIALNPCKGLRRAGDRAEAKKFTVWSPAELRSLIEAAEGDRLEAIARLAAASGARRGELLGATWLGFSAEKHTWTISQQVTPTRGGATITACKTKRSHRTISLDADTAAAVEEHRERQLAERDAAGEAYADHDLIFADELGRPIHPSRLTEWFAVLRDKSKVRPGRLHDVRHSVATHLLTRGVPVHVVAERLGHATPVITMTIYAHVLPRDDQHAAEVMAAVLA